MSRVAAITKKKDKITRTQTRRVNYWTNDDDWGVAWDATFALDNKALARRYGMTLSQVTYRLKEIGADKLRQKWRHGESFLFSTIRESPTVKLEEKMAQNRAATMHGDDKRKARKGYKGRGRK